MVKRSDGSLPPRKEPGLLSGVFTRIFSVVFWVFCSLLLSILIEWVGIAFVWPEQGEHHAMSMLEKERSYLNHHFFTVSSEFDTALYRVTRHMTQWVAQDSGIDQVIAWMASPLRAQEGTFSEWGQRLYTHYQVYILAIPPIVQLFFVRLAIIVLSLLAFVLFGLMGLVDGLVERDLRRWGGGRESSNLYNLSRKAIFPLFILACVFYISSPVTVHPAWVIMPFAALFGLSIRVTFSRLKKYF